MKFREVFRYELALQARRPLTWVYFVAMFGITLQIALQAYTGSARSGGYFFNSPFVIDNVTLLASCMGLLVTASFAGDAAARDVHTRMHPLTYTSSVGKASYLGGRFLAALCLSAFVQLAPQAALLVATATPIVSQDLIGQFWFGSYASAYAGIAVCNTVVSGALFFLLATLSRRAIAGYLGAVGLFFLTMFVWQFIAGKMGLWAIARVMDPLALTVIGEFARTSTPAEKNLLPIAFNSHMQLNRLMWLCVAAAALALTYLRFRFEHTVVRNSRLSALRRRAPLPGAGAGLGASNDKAATPAQEEHGHPIGVPGPTRSFHSVTQARQTLALAVQSFSMIASSRGTLLLIAFTALLVMFGPDAINHLGVPLLPTTPQMATFVGNSGEVLWMIVPFGIVFYAGELVWRERDAGLNEISDSAPVPEWAMFAGKITGLCLALAVYQLFLILACLLIQLRLGYNDFELGLYSRVFLGIRLSDHVLVALLAFAVHVLVNNKYAGHMTALVAYAFATFSSELGIDHHLLAYGSHPGLTYSALTGFEPFVGPWLWFRLYWSAWAILLAVATRLLWTRGKENNVGSRSRTVRQRLTRSAMGAAALATMLIVTAGGFIFYNTNVLNAYERSNGRVERLVEYERRYGQFRDIVQPRLAGLSLHVELYPDRRAAEVRATYRLVNDGDNAIDSIHLATMAAVETGTAEFDRPATRVLVDERLHYAIYRLQAPLLPGDSLAMHVTVRFTPHGFTNAPLDGAVTSSATFFDGNDWLPAIGYQPSRELQGAGDRTLYGLAARVPARVEDADTATTAETTHRVALDAVIGTSQRQVAIAPGALKRTWTEKGRRYFQYATDVPIRNDFAIYSAEYAVRDAQWQDVHIQVVHHPKHTLNVDRIVRSIQASLAYLTRTLGPYPHRQLRLIEHSGSGNSLHAYPVNISYEEEFSLLNPDVDPRKVDFPFAIVAHEIAHQWWGNQLSPAPVEGATLLTESLAWYSAMGVVQSASGDAELVRLLDLLREAYLTPRAVAGVPLLRANDQFLAYRKGPFAMYALREYVGAERVDSALRQLLQKAARQNAPPQTSLSLYRELQAVTPDSLRYLLADLFAKNTYWELETRQVASSQLPAGDWQVTLDVRARKVTADTMGVITDVPMHDLVEIGVYALTRDGTRGTPLYLRMHRLHSGEQRLVVTVPAQPGSAGIDPRRLLIDGKGDDNVREITWPRPK